MLSLRARKHTTSSGFSQLFMTPAPLDHARDVGIVGPILRGGGCKVFWKQYRCSVGHCTMQGRDRHRKIAERAK